MWCTECVMNQCYQPHCHNFLSSKYNVCPKTVALKKSKWLVKHFLSWFLFLVQPSVSDSRSEFRPTARRWWFIKSGIRCVCAKQELRGTHYCPWRACREPGADGRKGPPQPVAPDELMSGGQVRRPELLLQSRSLGVWFPSCFAFRLCTLWTGQWGQTLAVQLDMHVNRASACGTQHL